jgi:hypothetical protein
MAKALDEQQRQPDIAALAFEERLSRTSFSGVPAVETDFCLIFAPWRLR